MTYPITFKSLKGNTFTFDLDKNTTIGDIRKMLAKNSDTQPAQIKIVYSGQALNDDHELAQNFNLNLGTLVNFYITETKKKEASFPTEDSNNELFDFYRKQEPETAVDYDSTVFFKTLHGLHYQMHIHDGDQLAKVKVALESKTAILAECQRLIFCGQLISGDEKRFYLNPSRDDISPFNIRELRNHAHIHLVQRMKSPTPPPVADHKQDLARLVQANSEQLITLYRVNYGNPFSQKDVKNLYEADMMYVTDNLDEALQAVAARSQKQHEAKTITLQTIVMKKSEYAQLKDAGFAQSENWTLPLKKKENDSNIAFLPLFATTFINGKLPQLSIPNYTETPLNILHTYEHVSAERFKVSLAVNDFIRNAAASNAIIAPSAAELNGDAYGFFLNPLEEEVNLFLPEPDANNEYAAGDRDFLVAGVAVLAKLIHLAQQNQNKLSAPRGPAGFIPLLNIDDVKTHFGQYADTLLKTLIQYVNVLDPRLTGENVDLANIRLLAMQRLFGVYTTYWQQLTPSEQETITVKLHLEQAAPALQQPEKIELNPETAPGERALQKCLLLSGSLLAGEPTFLADASMVGVKQNSGTFIHSLLPDPEDGSIIAFQLSNAMDIVQELAKLVESGFALVLHNTNLDTRAKLLIELKNFYEQQRKENSSYQDYPAFPSFTFVATSDKDKTGLPHGILPYFDPSVFKAINVLPSFIGTDDKVEVRVAIMEQLGIKPSETCVLETAVKAHGSEAQELLGQGYNYQNIDAAQLLSSVRSLVQQQKIKYINDDKSFTLWFMDSFKQSALENILKTPQDALRQWNSLGMYNQYLWSEEYEEQITNQSTVGATTSAINNPPPSQAQAVSKFGFSNNNNQNDKPIQNINNSEITCSKDIYRL
ncbi:MAG: hypothetical protein HKM04_04725 [Legionellales bacterium]|nr:hypothetical protein [Legionellales bacterium]